MAGKDYTRICNGCGERWLLPKEWATEKADCYTVKVGQLMSSIEVRFTFAAAV
jgi:hypothetical protein